MLRLPAVAGRFYPSNPAELTSLVNKYAKKELGNAPAHVRACLVRTRDMCIRGTWRGRCLRVSLAEKDFDPGRAPFSARGAGAILSREHGGRRWRRGN